jgi:hypothetical protein
MNKQTKYYKNPSRSEEAEYKPYVPQYQIRGIEPEPYEHNSMSTRPIILKPNPLPSDNPRAKRTGIRNVDYAREVDSPIGVGKGLVPNVGNNMEHTWSGVDNIVDDLSDLNPDQLMIDNNDLIDMDAIRSSTDKEFLDETDLKGMLDNSERLSVINELSDDEYMLVVKGTPMLVGDLTKIQETVSTLVLSDRYESVSIDDIVVIKRIKLKVGVFLE